MTILNVEYLFTNIPLEETTSVCCDSLFSNYAKLDNINSIKSEKLFKSSSTEQLFLISKEKRIKKLMELQINEQIWLNECPDEFKPA